VSAPLGALPTITAMTSFPLIVTALALLLQPPPEAPPATAVRVERVPVLMYHVVADPPPGAAWPHLFVSPAELEAQVSWLERRGFVGVTLSRVWANWHHGGRLPARPVVLTFDDGYRSVATRALPILRRRGWPAVLDLKVGNLEPGSFTEADVRKLLDSGWELGAHTITHPDLRTVDDAALEREVAGSRAEIVNRFGVPVAFFCYPAGRYDSRVIAAVRRAGFLGAMTTLEGLATPRAPFELRRIRVDRGDGVRGLANALRARTAASRGSAPPAPASDSHG
jgi:peptidoglycan/xylan/chitin deacetylase (PgdA/CDA1 family)